MSPVRMSRIEQPVRAVLAFFEALNGKDIPAMMRLISDGCQFEGIDNQDGTPRIGKEAIAAYWEHFLEQRPDFQLAGEDAFGLGNRCVMRWRAEWTDSHGHKQQRRGVDIFEFKDRLIVKQYTYGKNSPM